MRGPGGAFAPFNPGISCLTGLQPLRNRVPASPLKFPTTLPSQPWGLLEISMVTGALAPCLGIGAKGAPEPPLTPCPSSLPTGLFNMVFAVLPPWGPWSDNVVPLVRLSQCLIRTANGASLTLRARPLPPAAIAQPALQLQKQRTPLQAAASLDPKNLGQVCRSLEGDCGLAPEPGTWPEDLCMSCLVPGPLASHQGTCSGRLRPLAVLWRGARTGGTLMAPTSATYSSLPVPLSPQWRFIL